MQSLNLYCFFDEEGIYVTCIFKIYCDAKTILVNVSNEFYAENNEYAIRVCILLMFQMRHRLWTNQFMHGFEGNSIVSIKREHMLIKCFYYQY